MSRVYPKKLAPGHPKAVQGQTYEHVLVAEAALGRYMPQGAEVHHVDGDRTNSAPKNLVICQDTKYHRLLHRRQRALAASAHADWRECSYCHQYDDPANLYIQPNGGASRHRECARAYLRNYRVQGYIAPSRRKVSTREPLDV